MSKHNHTLEWHNEKRKIGELLPYDKNPRKITEKQKKDLMKSLQKFNLAEVPAINTDNLIIAGHQRLSILKELYGSDYEIDVRVPSRQLTEREYKEYNIRSNKNTGEWDFDVLADAFEYDDLVDWGFDNKELDVDLWQKEQIPEEKLDDLPEVAKNPISRLGDIFVIDGKHRVMCGDSTSKDDVEILMGGAKADMVFTDPPWNVDYGNVKENNIMGYKPRTILNDAMTTEEFKNFLELVFESLALYSKAGCPTYVVMSAQEWGNLMLSLKDNGYHWSSTIIWNKSHPVLSRKDYNTKYEPIWYGWLEGAPRLCPIEDHTQCDVWDVQRPIKSELHPTTKPIELVCIAIKNSSKSYNIILDLFLGSGTTLIACEQTKRICYGMELDPKYIDVILKRYRNLYPNSDIKCLNREFDINKLMNENEDN